MLKKFLYIFSSVVILLSSMQNSLVTIISFAQEGSILDSIEDSSWFDETGNVRYPITSADDEWDLLDTDARYEACRIPDSIVDELSTNDLIKLVEQYPLFNMLLSYSDDTQESFEVYCEKANALSELLKRDDCLEVVIEEYESYQVDEAAQFNREEYMSTHEGIDSIIDLMNDKEAVELAKADARVIYVTGILEIILTQPCLQNEMTSNDRQQVAAAMLEMNNKRAGSEIFEYQTYNTYCMLEDRDETVVAYLSLYETQQSRNDVVYGEAEASIVVPDPPDGGSVMLYTRSGTRFLGEYRTDVQEIPESLAMSYASDYPGGFYDPDNTGTTGYNCIAYSCLSLDSNNKKYRDQVWVSSSQPFSEDSKYLNPGKITGVNQVASNGSHYVLSVDMNYIYTARTGTTSGILVASKIGTGPLIYAPLGEIFSSTESLFYFK